MKDHRWLILRVIFLILFCLGILGIYALSQWINSLAGR
jgi:hypothetical protein